MKKAYGKLSIIALIAIIMITALVPASVTAEEKSIPKYVFYFIGDGLGAAQRQAAEFYLSETGEDSGANLVMNKFPVVGINTTYSANTLITDSAAAGTALATGYKTNSGMISVLPDGKEVKTLIECAEDAGMATGIVTTTRLTHATPATFASHNLSRNNENEIAADYLDSGVEFFAGGGVRNFLPADWKDSQLDAVGKAIKSKRSDDRNLIAEFIGKGYKTFYGWKGGENFMNFSPIGQKKVFAAFTYTHIPYEIDRINNENTVPSLSQMTQKGIDVLSKYDNGFFMMIEGGRIDHACHNNDVMGTIYDTLAFDEAVKTAYDFYLEHPDETLIVVVGDHETGGMGLGFANQYFMKMKELEGVKVSIEDVLKHVYDGDREAYYEYISENLSLEDLTEWEKSKIEYSMDMKDAGKSIVEFGSYDPLAIQTAQIVSGRAQIMWTSNGHTGTLIPMCAIGVCAEQFGGYKDNTEIGMAMADVMGFELTK